MDFFTVPTIRFGVLYCFFVIAHAPTKRVCSAHIHNPSLYRCQPESQAAASTVLLWATLPNSIRTTVFYLCSEASLRFRRWMAFWRNTGTDIGYQLLLAHFNFGLCPTVFVAVTFLR